MFDETITERKHHTIRMGRHFKPIDELAIAVWSGKPYRSPQIKLWTGPIRAINIYINMAEDGIFAVINTEDGKFLPINLLAMNDGLSEEDFKAWFKLPAGSHQAQILIWNKEINY